MLSIKKRLTFEAAHRLFGYSGKCEQLHGHSYKVEAVVSGGQIDRLGMILDFCTIKELLAGWINRYWDHNLLLNSLDPLSQLLIEKARDYELRSPYLFIQQNPTAEVMALHLLNAWSELLRAFDVRLESVELWETETASAKVEAADNA